MHVLPASCSPPGRVGLVLPSRSPVRLAADGVVLREWAEADVPSMVELFDDPDIGLRTPLPSPFTVADGEARVRRARQPDRLHLAVTTDGRSPLGEVMLFAAGELGYMVGARHRGRGLAVRALVLLRDYAHHTIGLDVLSLRIEPDNVASRAVAARAGFRVAVRSEATVTNKGRTYAVDVWRHARADEEALAAQRRSASDR